MVLGSISNIDSGLFSLYLKKPTVTFDILVVYSSTFCQIMVQYLSDNGSTYNKIMVQIILFHDLCEVTIHGNFFQYLTVAAITISNFGSI